MRSSGSGFRVGSSAFERVPPASWRHPLPALDDPEYNNAKDNHRPNLAHGLLHAANLLKPLAITGPRQSLSQGWAIAFQLAGSSGAGSLVADWSRGFFRIDTDIHWYPGVESQGVGRAGWRPHGTISKLIQPFLRHGLPLFAALLGSTPHQHLCLVRIHRQLHLRSTHVCQLES